MLKNIIILFISIIVLAVVGSVSSIFYMKRTQERVICDRSDKSLESCNNIEAKYYYDSMDGVYYLSEVNSKNITSRFEPSTCIIDAQSLHECIDTNEKKWIIMFNSYH